MTAFGRLQRLLLLVTLVVGVASAICVGCGEGAKGQLATASAPSGAELWLENCARCHNLRDPSSFSAEQWDAIVRHMRMRVPLTGEEQRAITEFLQSASGPAQ